MFISKSLPLLRRYFCSEYFLVHRSTFTHLINTFNNLFRFILRHLSFIRTYFFTKTVLKLIVLRIRVDCLAELSLPDIRFFKSLLGYELFLHLQGRTLSIPRLIIINHALFFEFFFHFKKFIFSLNVFHLR